MRPQQEQVLADLKTADGWVKSQEITDRTGVKGPRQIVKELRDMGYDIWSHRAGPNSLGYKFISDPEQRIAA